MDLPDRSIEKISIDELIMHTRKLFLLSRLIGAIDMCIVHGMNDTML